MAKHLQNKELVYTSSTSLNVLYTIHICNSASDITLIVPDGSLGNRITITNKNTGTVTLSGNISNVSATSVLYSGESIELFWNLTEWI